MRQTTVRSRCECQSLLVATLNEQRFVMSSYAVETDNQKEPAVASTIGAQKDRFDVGWLCPTCGRNTMRSFWVDSLEWWDIPTAAQPG